MSLDYSPEALRQHQRHKEVRARLNTIPVIKKLTIAPIEKFPPKTVVGVEISNMSAESLWRDWLAQRHLAPVPSSIASWEPYISIVCAEVRRQYGINKVDFESTRRTWKLVIPRQIAMALSKHLTRKSLPEIGRMMGGRDHTTVLHGIRRIQPVMDAVAAKLPPDASVCDWVKAMRDQANITPLAKTKRYITEKVTG